jgi:hypothetical protein
MTCHLGIVAHDTVAPDDAIMGDMAVRHDKAIVAHHSLPSVFGAAVDCNELPDGGIVSDFHTGFFTFKFEVLRSCRDYGSGENPAVFTDSCTIHDGYIAANPGAFADFYILVNDRKRINFDVGCDAGVMMNIGMWMNHSYLLYYWTLSRFTNCAISMVSVAILLPT